MLWLLVEAKPVILGEGGVVHSIQKFQVNPKYTTLFAPVLQCDARMSSSLGGFVSQRLKTCTNMNRRTKKKTHVSGIRRGCKISCPFGSHPRTKFNLKPRRWGLVLDSLAALPTPALSGWPIAFEVDPMMEVGPCSRKMFGPRAR